MDPTHRKHFTHAALECLQSASANYLEDVALIRSGRLTRDRLTIYCLDGASEDVVQGWLDYVSGVMAIAGET